MPNLTRKEIMRLFYRATMAAIGKDPDKKVQKLKAACSSDLQHLWEARLDGER